MPDNNVTPSMLVLSERYPAVLLCAHEDVEPDELAESFYCNNVCETGNCWCAGDNDAQLPEPVGLVDHRLSDEEWEYFKRDQMFYNEPWFLPTEHEDEENLNDEMIYSLQQPY